MFFIYINVRVKNKLIKQVLKNITNFKTNKNMKYKIKTI